MLGLSTRATRALRRQDLGPIGRPTCHASGSAIAPPRFAGTITSLFLVAGQVLVLVAELRFSDRVWGVPRLWCTSRDGNDDSEPRGRRSTCSTSRSWWQHATSRRAESITITRCEPEPRNSPLVLTEIPQVSQAVACLIQPRLVGATPFLMLSTRARWARIR